MKQVLFIVAATMLVGLSSKVVTSQLVEQVFCGEQSCIVPLRLSCEEMIEQYEFQGSCCSMESIPQTRGCRITIEAAGNCYWAPRCGVPLDECQFDDQLRCHTIFETGSTNACPSSDFDPFANTTAVCPPTAAPIMTNVGTDGENENISGAKLPSSSTSTLILVVSAVLGAVMVIN